MPIVPSYFLAEGKQEIKLEDQIDDNCLLRKFTSAVRSISRIFHRI